MDVDIVSLSRLQFALTALYHFLFVPLTLGLSILLAIMETVYVMTGRAGTARSGSRDKLVDSCGQPVDKLE